MCGVDRCLPERRSSASRRLVVPAPDNETVDNAGVGSVSCPELEVYGLSDREKYDSVLDAVSSLLSRLRLNLEVSGDDGVFSAWARRPTDRARPRPAIQNVARIPPAAAVVGLARTSSTSAGGGASEEDGMGGSPRANAVDEGGG